MSGPGHLPSALGWRGEGNSLQSPRIVRSPRESHILVGCLQAGAGAAAVAVAGWAPLAALTPPWRRRRRGNGQRGRCTRRSCRVTPVAQAEAQMGGIAGPAGGKAVAVAEAWKEAVIAAGGGDAASTRGRSWRRGRQTKSDGVSVELAALPRRNQDRGWGKGGPAGDGGGVANMRAEQTPMAPPFFCGRFECGYGLSAAFCLPRWRAALVCRRAT